MYIGIDIGGTKCAVVKGVGRDVREKIRFDTTDVASTLTRIYEAVASMGPADAIGVSCGGPLDEARGVILSPPNLPGWDEIPITEELTKRFGVPAYLCNDANACALAEWKYGAGVGAKHMIFLTFGTGFGAGVIADGRLLCGATGNAGEVGHVRLERRGPVGYGKAGSAEGFCSGGGLAKLGKAVAEKRLAQRRPVAWCPTEADLPSVTAKKLAEFAHAGDKEAKAVYATSGKELGKCLSLLMDLFDPDAIVIGSVFARSGDLLRPAMERVLKKEVLPPVLAHCRVLPAELGESIGDIAALTIAEYKGESV